MHFTKRLNIYLLNNKVFRAILIGMLVIASINAYADGEKYISAGTIRFVGKIIPHDDLIKIANKWNSDSNFVSIVVLGGRKSGDCTIQFIYICNDNNTKITDLLNSEKSKHQENIIAGMNFYESVSSNGPFKSEVRKAA